MDERRVRKLFDGFFNPHNSVSGTRAPVSCVAGLLTRGHGHHAFRQASTDGGLASGPGRVFLQPRQAQRQEALAPAGKYPLVHLPVTSH